MRGRIAILYALRRGFLTPDASGRGAGRISPSPVFSVAPPRGYMRHTVTVGPSGSASSRQRIFSFQEGNR